MKNGSAAFLALDVGSSKIAALLVRASGQGGMEILAAARSSSDGGLRRGVVVNIPTTIEAIQKVVAQIENQAHTPIAGITVAISGDHIACEDNGGVVVIRHAEVTALDVARALEEAKRIEIPAGREVIHALVQDFVLDGQTGIKHPIGMAGSALEARVHLISASTSAVQNLIKCVRRADLDLHTVTWQGIASAEAVLTEDEKNLGVVLLDIGGGTTDIVVFRDGAVRFSAVLPVGGERITHDLAMALRTPTADAEHLKCHYGAAVHSWVNPAEIVEVPAIGDRPPRKLARQRLVDVIHPRVEEIFEQAAELLQQAAVDGLLGGGVVLTGGTAKLNGIADLAEEVFASPVRIGVPLLPGRERLGVDWEDPAYACVCGLAQAALLTQLPIEWPRGGWWQRLLSRWLKR